MVQHQETVSAILPTIWRSFSGSTKVGGWGKKKKPSPPVTHVHLISAENLFACACLCTKTFQGGTKCHRHMSQDFKLVQLVRVLAYAGQLFQSTLSETVGQRDREIIWVGYQLSYHS